MAFKPLLILGVFLHILVHKLGTVFADISKERNFNQKGNTNSRSFNIEAFDMFSHIMLI